MRDMPKSDTFALYLSSSFLHSTLRAAKSLKVHKTIFENKLRFVYCSYLCMILCDAR